MWKEAIILGTLYILWLGMHGAHSQWKRYREAQRKAREEADSLNAISPLHSVPPPDCSLAGRCRRHASALLFAAAIHPATAETAKHYIVHLLIYSGYIVPPGH